MHDQAIAIKEKLTSEFPGNSDYQSELGASLNNRESPADKAELAGLFAEPSRTSGPLSKPSRKTPHTEDTCGTIGGT